MDITYSQTPSTLIFPPQAPFSWTRRWAAAHRSDGETSPRHSYRIAGSARDRAELSVVVAFARRHGARVELH